MISVPSIVSEHSDTRVSCQLIASMMPTSSTSVRQSTSRLMMPFENRSFSELTSFMMRTIILPAERESKKLNDSFCT